MRRESSDDLPAFGRPDEADVGEQLELQLDPALVAGQPALGEARRLARGGGEVLVAAPARAAAGDDRALPGRDEVVGGAVASRATCVPGGTPDDEVVAVGAVALRALPVRAARRLVVRACA